MLLTTTFISYCKMDSNAQLLQKCFIFLSELSGVAYQKMELLKQKMFESTITVLELDDKVTEMVRYFPQIAYRRVLDELERQSIRITRSKARESLQRTDAVGVTERRLQGTVSRRKYSVKGPLFL